jgi:dienelactone hydrolase
VRTVTVAVLFLCLQISSAQGQRRDIDIKTSDGVTLKGTLYTAGKPGPGVILFHMCDGKGREPWENLATQLMREGLHVLTFNYRGIGGSGGERLPHNLSLEQAIEYWQTKWAGDIDVAVKTLLSQPGVNTQRIGVGGASCGVTMSLLTARKYPQLVRTTVLLAGPYSRLEREFIEKTDLVPVLGVASEEDGLATKWMREIIKSSKSPASKVVIYNGAGHGTNMFAKEKELEPMLVSWFKEKLKSGE